MEWGIDMKYYGSLTLDHTDLDTNAGEKLKNALIAIGWNWVETTAYMIATQNINAIWEGIVLAAKHDADMGTLSALTFHVQSVNTETACKPPSSAGNHPNALDDIRKKPTPTVS